MIVVVLIGILAAVAIQQVAGTSDPYAAVDEARKIHAAMVSARARAIATQRQHRFVLEPGGVWRIQEENPPGTWTATADSGTAAAIVTMDASSSGTVVYYARGRVDAPKTIQVTVHGHTQAFDILASGLVRW
jgi:Tfp pilus assembly protein FimT